MDEAATNYYHYAGSTDNYRTAYNHYATACRNNDSTYDNDNSRTWTTTSA